jgi:hypothetical protein
VCTISISYDNKGYIKLVYIREREREKKREREDLDIFHSFPPLRIKKELLKALRMIEPTIFVPR